MIFRLEAIGNLRSSAPSYESSIQARYRLRIGHEYPLSSRMIGLAILFHPIILSIHDTEFSLQSLPFLSFTNLFSSTAYSIGSSFVNGSMKPPTMRDKASDSGKSPTH